MADDSAKDPVQDSLLREIDEELRHEHYAKLWKKYGHLVIGAAVALVVVVAGYQGWRAWDRNNRLARSAEFVRALDLAEGGETGRAGEALTGLASTSGGYGLLARFEAAALKARQGDEAGAAAAYHAIATGAATRDPYRGLATVLGVMHEIDTAAPDTIAARLAPLMAETDPWRHSARELAALAALRAGDRDRAREMFGRLTEDAATPEAMRERAHEMTAQLGGEVRP